MECAATAGAGPDAINFLDVDNLLDPFELRGQRAAVDLARTVTPGLRRHRLACGAGLAQCRLDILEAKLKLVWIELLGLAPEPVPHERIDDRLQPLDLSIGLTFGERKIGPCRPFCCQCAGLLTCDSSTKAGLSRIAKNRA